jgi:hypothetical protein
MEHKYRLVEVVNSEQRKEFIFFPVRLYKNDENWIRPLDNDIEHVFDPEKNKLYRNGDCCRWLLLNEQNDTVGRIAAFVDYKSAEKNEQPTGGMGFFECINDKTAAFILFDCCRDWLIQKGMEAMDGPINFGERDRWWGCLVEGFGKPNYLNNYNPPYYHRLFEDYGFKDYFRQFTYNRSISVEGINPILYEKAERIFKNPDYTFCHYRKKQAKKFMSDFQVIYNKGWAKFPGAKPLLDIHVKGIFNSIKPILDEKIIWFAYYRNNPIAFFLMMPEINPIIKKFNGKLGLIEKIKFAWYLRRKTCFKAFGFVFGVIPEFQFKGVEGAIIMAFAKVALSKDFPYKEIEMNWIGDFNPAMMHLLEELGAKVAKIHITYRYLFDSSKEFKRHTRVS